MRSQLSLFEAAGGPRVFEQAEVVHPAGLGGRYRRIVGEFWTARQKQMTPLHYVISYRASFKPELPAYFIERYCPAGGLVFDPFAGRGTTALQANLMGHPAAASDVNPLAVRMTRAKCRPVPLDEIQRRLAQVDWNAEPSTAGEPLEDLEPFYHKDTLRELLNLRAFLRRNGLSADYADFADFKKERERNKKKALAGGLPQSEIRNPKSEIPVGEVDRFIELIALSRLHGHSDGFFSVYSFPQISVPPASQRRINRQRNQRPEYRPVAERIIRKARHALKGLDLAALRAVSAADRFFVASADDLPASQLPDESVDLIVTSPPFLAKADYLLDNWLEFWFAGIDSTPLRQTLIQTPNLDTWREFIARSMAQMARVLKPGGHAVIEVGEVEHDGAVVHLDDMIVQLADFGFRISDFGLKNKKTGAASKSEIRLAVIEVLIHSQKFTKLANCFGVSNNAKGTNTNRLVVLRKA